MLLLEKEVSCKGRMYRAFCSCRLSLSINELLLENYLILTSIFVFVPALLWRKLQKARHLLPLGTSHALHRDAGRSSIDEERERFAWMFWIRKFACVVVMKIRKQASIVSLRDMSDSLPYALSIRPLMTVLDMVAILIRII
jgi:hypothetical protein